MTRTGKGPKAAKHTADKISARSEKPLKGKGAAGYIHVEATTPARPDVGLVPQFRQRKPPKTYRYDSSLSPALDWDENPARAQGEAAIRDILDLDAGAIDAAATLDAAKAAARAALAKAKDAAARLKALGRPFLNWAGKAERTSFDVPTLPLFVHERLSTTAIIDSLTAHQRKADAPQGSLFELFGDSQRPITEKLRAYEYQDQWVNRLILGDSLVVMNSLLQYESMGGKVQMIYIDPPYGVRFGSNFQPFVRRRDVDHNDDADMTREPEMVRAYRDTWELGLHSYLAYLRDRLLVSRDLLSPSGSVFVQISDDNVHHAREIAEEVFGSENFVVSILLKKTGAQKGNLVEPVNDYLLWFTKDKSQATARFSKVYERASIAEQITEGFDIVELPDGTEIPIDGLSARQKKDYAAEPELIFADFPQAKIFAANPLTSGGYRKNQSVPFVFRGKSFDPGIARGQCWKHTAKTEDGSPSGMDRLAAANRIFVGKSQLRFKRYTTDFAFKELTNWWDGIGGAGKPIYVVQTNAEIVKRCLLMTTLPGDLVLDPTCGSGTTAFVAERWGRRWITIDTSRVPLALARQRLLTATFPYYELRDSRRGPAGGFVYVQKQNRLGEEVGGIVPHITSSTIANGEHPIEDVIVDRPEVDGAIVRVSGPFCVEATIPTPAGFEGGDDKRESIAGDYSNHVDRMLNVLRRAPVLQVGGGKTVALANIRLPTKSLALSAEAVVAATAEGQRATLSDAVVAAHEANTGGLPLSRKPVAILFGPDNAAVSERAVLEAAKEANAKSYSHLYVIGFAIQPNARALIEQAEAALGIAATYVQATPDIMMGDLLKTTRASQVFSVCGMPEIAVRMAKPGKSDGPPRYQVELLGLDTFDPATMETDHRKGDDVPCWMLDTNYDGLVFHAAQVFFPRTAAWDNLRKALKATHDDAVWDHLAGAASAPFEAGEHRRVAVKVIDDRGNELLVVAELTDKK